jgi:hypothetical protein
VRKAREQSMSQTTRLMASRKKNIWLSMVNLRKRILMEIMTRRSTMGMRETNKKRKRKKETKCHIVTTANTIMREENSHLLKTRRKKKTKLRKRSQL